MFRLICATLIVQIKNSWARPMFRFTLLASPFLNTILIYEMFQHSHTVNAAAFIILGSGLMGLWSSICFSSVGDITRERNMGVLPFLFSSPTNFNVLILAKVIGNTLLAMLSLLVAIATADLLFDLTLSIPHPVLLTLMLLIMVISFIAISVPISYAMLLSRKTGLYMNLLDIPVTLLCGFVFPLSTLPQWTRPLSAVLIPTWTTQLVQQTLQVKIDWSVIKVASIWTIVLLALYTTLTTLLWRIIATQVRQTGSLEVQE